MAVLKTGSRGAEVQSLQQQLANAGYDIAVDGIYGSQTANAVRQYQQANNLTVDGLAGPQTLGSLASRSNTASGASSASGGTSAGDMITSMYDQQRLNAIAQLQAQGQQQESAIGKQEAAIAPAYQQAATRTNVSAQQAAQRLRELMAGSGVATGQQNTQQARVQAANQQSLSDLGLRRREEEAGIDQARTDLASQQALGLSQIEADIAAQQQAALINQYNTDRQLALSQAGLTGYYNGQPTLGMLSLQRKSSSGGGGGSVAPTSILNTPEFKFYSDYVSRNYATDPRGAISYLNQQVMAGNLTAEMASSIAAASGIDVNAVMSGGGSNTTDILNNFMSNPTAAGARALANDPAGQQLIMSVGRNPGLYVNASDAAAHTLWVHLRGAVN
jgi:peptidoglycan hydrolase-like protein with peptidoglycan-binding domain